MTDDVEAQLRAVLRGRAELPSVAGDPVPLVQGRMRRRARRRGIAAAVTSAACVSGLAIAVGVLNRAPTASQPAAPPANSGQPAGPSAQPTAPVRSSPAPSAPATSAVATALTATLPANVSSISLPAADQFDTLGTDSGRLLVTGTVAPSAASSSGQDAECAAAAVNATPLSLGAVTTTSCTDPASSGETVVPAVTESPDPKSDSGLTATVRITRRDPTSGKVTTGQVVMTYRPSSTSNLYTAYGGGSLWLYDVDTTSGAEAVQISTTSGRVDDVVRVPQLYKPIVAADADGLWLGNSIEGAEGAALFHIAPNSHTVITVVAGTDKAVDWLLASDGHVWAGIRPNDGSGSPTLWRFDGVKATVALQRAEPGLQAGIVTVVGGEKDGLWTAVPYPPFASTGSPNDNHQLYVIRLDPDTGAQTVEAVLPPSPEVTAQFGIAVGAAAFSDGAFFLLEPPSQGGGYEGYSGLVRVNRLP
jgi:hypothetical protein